MDYVNCALNFFSLASRSTELSLVVVDMMMLGSAVDGQVERLKVHKKGI